MLGEALDLLERMALHPNWPRCSASASRPPIGSAIDRQLLPPGGYLQDGSGDDPAVVGADGGVHGIQGLYVADASMMPAITRGNPNLPVAAIAARIAAAGLGGFDVQRLRVTASRTVRPAVSASRT